MLAGCLTEKGADDLRRVASSRLKTVMLDVTSLDSVRKAMEWTKKEVGDKGKKDYLRPKHWLDLLLIHTSAVHKGYLNI